jgi:cyclic pyranopterin phosphate synthase
MAKITHLNSNGEAHMVDISGKNDTARSAIALTKIELPESVIDAINGDNLPKGDLFATARIAGIQAAKKCSELIPLCHPLPLTKVTIDLSLHDSIMSVTASCKTIGKTGIEMEALTAASIAALTVYDMCKSIDKDIVISQTRLLEKSGGKSGLWRSKITGEINID